MLSALPAASDASQRPAWLGCSLAKFDRLICARHRGEVSTPAGASPCSFKHDAKGEMLDALVRANNPSNARLNFSLTTDVLYLIIKLYSSVL
jgi:hypothetical protein